MKMTYKPLLVVISGPTASGKSALALQLADYFNTEIISADSRQFYRQIPIGTAQPTSAELDQIKHHFIGNLSLEETMSAGQFSRAAQVLLNELFKTKKIAILVGGTGLYIKALLHGLDEIPPSDESIREQLNKRWLKGGIEGLVTELKTLDPDFCEDADLKNPQRVIRALEVCLTTGKAFSSFRSNAKQINPFNVLHFSLNPPRDLLYHNIDQRVDAMLNAGLLLEAKTVYPFKHFNALKTVGYVELFEFFEGKITFEKAADLIKQHTRNYAKRQITWFKKMEAVQIIEQPKLGDLIHQIEAVL